MYIGPEHHTLSSLAAGLHMKPPASSEPGGHWLSETALAEGRENLVILVIKIKAFLTFVFCALNRSIKLWTEVTQQCVHNSSVTRLILVIIFMPLWIKDGHLLIARNSIPLANEREGVVQSNPLKHEQIYLLSTVSSNMFILMCVHFL